MTKSNVHITLDAITLACTADEIGSVFDGILREMRAAAPFLTDEDRAALRRIMAHEAGALTVGELFPDFARGSGEHLTLRRLRTAQFVRPGGRDMWDRESPVEVKPFARLAWDRLGEAAIFGDAPAVEPPETSVAEPAAAGEEEVDLALPDVDEPEGEPEEEVVTVGSKEHRAAGWDEDDVLDFLNDRKDTLG